MKEKGAVSKSDLFVKIKKREAIASLFLILNIESKI